MIWPYKANLLAFSEDSGFEDLAISTSYRLSVARSHRLHRGCRPLVLCSHNMTPRHEKLASDVKLFSRVSFDLPYVQNDMHLFCLEKKKKNVHLMGYYLLISSRVTGHLECQTSATCFCARKISARILTYHIYV